MITDKQIEETARSYANRYMATADAPFIFEGFVKGAHWAIEEFLKGLWHDAKEEPKRNGKILIATNEGEYCQVLSDGSCWERRYAFFSSPKWLYVDDLLPKKGGSDEGV